MAIQNFDTAMVGGDFKGQPTGEYTVAAKGSAGDTIYVRPGYTSLPQGYSVTAPEAPTAPMTGQEYASKLFSSFGISTPQSADFQAAERQSIADELEAARRARASAAESIFGAKTAQAEKSGAIQTIGAERALGAQAGFSISTANMAFMNSIADKIEETKRGIEKDKQTYIDEGNWKAMELAQSRIDKLNDRKDAILLKLADAAATYDQNVITNTRADKLLEYQLGEEGRTISAETRATAEKERQTVLNLKLQYPTANISSEDGIETAINKATPFLEQTRLLELQKLQAEVANARRLASGGGGGGITIGNFTADEVAMANSIAGKVIGADGTIDYSAINEATKNLPTQSQVNVTALILKASGQQESAASTTTPPVSQFGATNTGFGNVSINDYSNRLKSDGFSNAVIRNFLKSAGYEQAAIDAVAPPSIGSAISDITKYLFEGKK